MLAEHDLQQATRFRGTCGHIPSSRCSISMPPAALSTHKGKLALSLRIRPRLTKKRWWRRTGSNRRPDACKATALPAELRPLIMVGLGRLERPTSPLSGVRSNHLSYRPQPVARSTAVASRNAASSDPAYPDEKEKRGRPLQVPPMGL